MVLKQIKLGRLVSQRRDAEEKMKEMLQMIETIETEKRSFSSEEQKKYSVLEKQLEQIDAEFEKEGLTMDEAVEQLEDIKTRSKQAGSLTNSNEYKSLKRRSENPLEVRGYRGNERIGKHNTDVTIGDLVTSFATGKYRSDQVRQAMNTTGSGILVPSEVYNGVIDLLRDDNFLNEVTVYPMASKSLVIPKVVGDIEAAFKAENEPIVESAPVFDGVTLESKPLYAMTSISLELLESSGVDIGLAVTQIMVASMRKAIQGEMLYGWSANVGGFEGLAKNPDINTVDAAEVTYEAIAEGIDKIREWNGKPNGLIMRMNNSLGLDLLKDSTGQFIQSPNFMNNLKRYDVYYGMLPNSAFVLDFRSIAWGILSEGGLQLDIDRQGDAFNRGQIKIRARINSDFALTNPSLISHIRPATP
jgi:HK97 family phage major capsid protein